MGTQKYLTKQNQRKRINERDLNILEKIAREEMAIKYDGLGKWHSELHSTDKLVGGYKI